MSVTGERSIGRGDRGVSLMDERASVFTFAWLATHRDRLHTLLFRGKRLSLIVLWDDKGDEPIDHDEDEIHALLRIVDGPDAVASTATQEPPA